MRDIFLPFPNLRAKTLAGRNFGVPEKMLNFSHKKLWRLVNFGTNFMEKTYEKFTEKANFHVKKSLKLPEKKLLRILTNIPDFQ